MSITSMLNVCISISLSLSLFLYFSLSFFLSFFSSLSYMGSLTKWPLSILFCQQPKRRGECPSNAIIQSTPSQRYTCFPLSKTNSFSFCDIEPPPPSISLSLSLFFYLSVYPPLFLFPISLSSFSLFSIFFYVWSRNRPQYANVFPIRRTG